MGLKRFKALSYGTVGAMVGASMYRKIEADANINIRATYLRPNVLTERSSDMFNSVCTTLTMSIEEFTMFNNALIKVTVVGFFVFANLIKWMIFGKLSDTEKGHLKDKVGYTIWEFCFGFLLFLNQILRDNNITTYSEVVRSELVQYSGLFFCVLLLKGFHVLSSDRAYSIANNPNANRKEYRRLAWGIAIIHFVDVVLIYRFYYVLRYTYSGDSGLTFMHNILVAIFGFEILHMYPLILFTGIKYAMLYYQRFYRSSNLEDQDLLSNRNVKILNVIEFCVNFIRLGMACVFSVVFLHYYTFPVHILPTSYLTFRLLLVRARCLISIQRRRFRLKKVSHRMKLIADTSCIICFDDLNNSSSDGVCCLQNCDHKYHYKCLKSWLSYSASCPVCRTQVQ